MKTNKNECFAYTRVSTVKQGEGVSLEAQREAIERYASQHGLFIVRWFEEKETAAKQGRPVFTEMIKLLHGQKASGLIMHKIDRSARNLRDWATVGELQDHGIAVHFAAESVDFSSRGGRLTADIQAVIAADYIRNLREETMKGIRGRLKQGLYPWKAPIGYLDNGGGKPKTIDPVKGAMVKRLFELYASTEHSLWSLVQEANDMGLRSDKNKPVGKTCIENMLSNPFYIGLLHVPKWGETYNGIHRPLVSVETFKKVEQVRAGKWAKKATKHDFLFKRVFQCKRCRKTVIGEKQKGFIYYRCHTKGCSGAAIREEKIESFLSAHLQRMKLPSFSNQMIEAVFTVENNLAVTKAQGQSLKLQLSNNEARKRDLLDALLDKLIDKKTYENRITELRLQETELSELLEKSQNYIETPETLRRTRELFKSLYLTYFSADRSEKRQLLKILYANCWIDGRNIELEPKNWVLELAQCLNVLFGPPTSATTRSRKELGSSAIQNVLDVSNCRQLAEFVKLAEAIDNKSPTSKLPEPETQDVFQQAA